MIEHKIPFTMDEVFGVGMEYQVPDFITPPNGEALNLGAGNKIIKGVTNLDAPDWYAPSLSKYDDGTVSAIHAYHFLEHLDKDNVIEMLKECQRVLAVGGVMNVVVPHWDTEMAHHDLDHKTFWSESSFRQLFHNPYYDGTMPRDWQFKIHSVMIMGIVQRNLVVVAQLVKEDHK